VINSLSLNATGYWLIKVVIVAYFLGPACTTL